MRTIIETKTNNEEPSKFIIASCEKGSATNSENLGIICAKIKERTKAYPNLVSYAAKSVFESFNSAPVEERHKENNGSKKNPVLKFFNKKGPFKNKIRKCPDVTIGMPRVLTMYSLAPFFTSYFESLGVKNIVWSDYTSQKMFKGGSKRGASDHCFPSKLGIVHVDNLLSRKDVDIIFFPTLINLKNSLKFTQSSWTCPTVQIAPSLCKTTFTKDRDLFLEKGVKFLNTPLHMSEPGHLERQMYDAFRKILNLKAKDNKFAVQEGWAALEKYKKDLTARGREVLDKLIDNKDVGIVLLGRPYHNDPGINHGIVYELQQRGYPIFSMESLPDSKEELSCLFKNDILKGHIRHPREISDVFGNAYNVNSSFKIWIAKYAARCPNLAVIDLSSFKCGHDAPIYHIIEGILEASQTPYFTFHDIDENRPASSIKMRVETIDYTLKQHARGLKEKSSVLQTSVNDNQLKVSESQLLLQPALL
jgi:predicted nucleotide-binding protein (sugar kinase/HSP70/actin superfamily)